MPKSDGEWVTIRGSHIFIDGDGKPTKGSPEVLKWAKKEYRKGGKPDKSPAKKEADLYIEETIHSDKTIDAFKNADAIKFGNWTLKSDGEDKFSLSHSKKGDLGKVSVMEAARIIKGKLKDLPDNQKISIRSELGESSKYTMGDDGRLRNEAGEEQQFEKLASKIASENGEVQFLKDDYVPSTVELAHDNPSARRLYDRIASGKLMKPKELLESSAWQNVVRQVKDLERKIGDTSTIDTQERDGIRSRVMQDYLRRGSMEKQEDGTYNPTGDIKHEYKAEVVLGLPASGKSTSIINPDSQRLGAFTIDTDDIGAMLPEAEKYGHKACSAVFKEARDIRQKVMDEFLHGSRKGDNIIMQAIGNDEDYISNTVIKQLEDAGYDVRVRYQDTDPITSMNRLVARTIQDGRYVPPSVSLKYGDAPRKVFGDIKHKKNSKGIPYGKEFL